MFYYTFFPSKKFVYLFYVLCLAQTLTRFQVHGHTNSSKPIAYFVLSEDYPLKSDFEFVPSNNRLILIAKLVTYALTDAQKKRFDEIIFVDHFDVEHIVKAIKSRAKIMGNVRVIANDDTIFQIVASVREQLAIPGPTLDELLPFCCKQTSKQRLEGSSVAYPKFLMFDYQLYIANPNHYVDKVGNKLGFPIIVKRTMLKNKFFVVNF